MERKKIIYTHPHQIFQNAPTPAFQGCFSKDRSPTQKQQETVTSHVCLPSHSTYLKLWDGLVTVKNSGLFLFSHGHNLHIFVLLLLYKGKEQVNILTHWQLINYTCCTETSIKTLFYELDFCDFRPGYWLLFNFQK